MSQEITIVLSGFKTIEEAQAWVNAYSGGVEQDMSVWAEKPGGGYSFPFNCEYHNRDTTALSIKLPLTHPDTYKIEKS